MIPVKDTIWSRENQRNTDNRVVFEKVLREAYGDIDVFAAGHHLMFTRHTFTHAEEIPSADTLMFSHFIAEKIWGPTYRVELTRLALEPIATRDLLFTEMFYARNRNP